MAREDAPNGRVLAAVLTFSAPEHVKRCVAALEAQVRPPDGVLVIDNRGTPAVAPDMFEGALPVDVHRTGNNLGPGGGFATAVDLFLSSDFDYVWLMDDDVAPEPMCLDVLLGALVDRDDAIAMPFVDPNGDTAKRFEGWGWYGALIPRAVATAHGGPRADFVWWLEDTEYLAGRLPNEGVSVLRPPAVAWWATVRTAKNKPAWKYFYESRNVTYVHLHTLHARYVHNLVRELIKRMRRIARYEDERTRKALALVRGVIDGVRGKLGMTYPLDVAHRPDAREGDAAQAPDDPEDQAAGWLEQAASKAHEGDLAGAAECAARAGRLLPPGHVDRHEALAQAARLFAANGRNDEALTAWTDAATAAPDDAQLAHDLGELGTALRKAGRWSEAEASGLEALELADRVAADRAHEIAHSLAVTYKYTGRFDEAEALYRRALDVAERDGDVGFVATICHNLGGLAHARGAHGDGEPWARRAVEIREATGDALSLAGDNGALAALLVGLDRHDEARDLLAECHRTFTERLGADHYEVGVVEGNLAALELAVGRLDVAEVHARHALAIKEAALGENNPELGVTLTTLGVIRRKQGFHEEAAALHRRALDVLGPAVGPTHPLLVRVRANLAAANELRATP